MAIVIAPSPRILVVSKCFEKYDAGISSQASLRCLSSHLFCADPVDGTIHATSGGSSPGMKQFSGGIRAAPPF